MKKKALAKKKLLKKPLPLDRGKKASVSVAKNRDVTKTPKPASAKNELTEKDLVRLHLFNKVNLDEVWGLMKELPSHHLKKGDVLIQKGQTNAILYLIIRGRLSVNLDTPKGKPLAFIESGNAVGELSVIDHRPTSADVVAASPAWLLSINEETFWRLIVASHQFAKNMFLLLTQRLRASNFTIAENIRLRALLEHDATVDGLTGLRNRRWLDFNLTRFIERHLRSKLPLSIIMLDVDHFKKFNDTYGHAAGDRVLSTVGRTMEMRLRPGDFGVRYGGEEFMIILQETDLAGGFVAAERFRQKISQTEVHTIEGTILPCVTISLGVGQLLEKETMPEFLKRVDDALYRAKNRGRNCTEPAWKE